MIDIECETCVKTKETCGHYDSISVIRRTSGWLGHHSKCPHYKKKSEFKGN